MKMNLNKVFKVIFILVIFFSFSIIPNNFSLVSAQNEAVNINQGNIETLKFKDANIKTVIRSIAEKAYRDGRSVNIVASPVVEGTVTVDLEDIDWLTALEVVIRPYNYSYEWVGGNTIVVDAIEKITEREKRAKERQEVEIPRTKVFKLKFIDANDAKNAIEPILSPAGRVTVLEITGQAGWEFGTDVTKRAKVEKERISKTNVLLVSDIVKKIEAISDLISQIDKKPKQILIKARIMEVNRNFLKEIGFNWGTGVNETPALMMTRQDKTVYYDTVDDEGYPIKGTYKDVSGPVPQALNSAATKAFTSQILPGADKGLEFLFQKLSGTEFEFLFKALEDSDQSDTLSAPLIHTLNNQEASILVGSQYPIILSQTSTDTGNIIGGKLEGYKDIGVQLNVIPQIAGENEDFVNMIIHPAVTSRLRDISVTSETGTVLVSYPEISTREAQTQLIIKDGETIVLGGLLKDQSIKGEVGIPFLKDIPLLGWLFRKNTTDNQKIDLLIFITVHIIEPGVTDSIALTESENVIDGIGEQEKNKK